MPRTEEQVQELVREMYSVADSSEWQVDPEEIRTQRARRGLPLPDVKVLVLVAAAVILIVVGIVVANGSPSRRTTASPPTSSTTASNPQTVVAPDLVGLSQEAAANSLGRAGLNLGNVTLAASGQYASGVVVSQTPAAGTSVKERGERPCRHLNRSIGYIWNYARTDDQHHRPCHWFGHRPEPDRPVSKSSGQCTGASRAEHRYRQSGDKLTACSRTCGQRIALRRGRRLSQVRQSTSWCQPAPLHPGS